MIKRSPFKFLDAYEKEDKEIFFGREGEVETLYQMTFQTNLILVYGMSGTGKTSIIRCGLANCFDSSDWFDIYIRRGENINASLVRELKARDKEGSFDEDFGIPQMVHSLYLDYLRPIYLVFDQFEELFILGAEEEQLAFIQEVKALLEPDLPCKIVIAMREEYLAHLSEFEKVVPSLFDKRLRVEPMTRANARRVILRTAADKKFNIQLSTDDVAEEIIENVTEGKGRVQLTYLQVLLDKLYRLAHERNPERIAFDMELVREVGRIEDVLVDFLEEQLDVFQSEIGPRDAALKWLKVFVSDKGTKIPVYRNELPDLLPDLSEELILQYLYFFVNRRILRPLDNDQYELTHDSLAARIFHSRPRGVAMPKKIPDYGKPVSPLTRFEPYSKEMASVFFGRDEDIKELFEKIANDTLVRTTLVFGPMGVGKTSLILAGLIPRLELLFKVQYLRWSREFIDNSLVFQMLDKPPQPGEEPRILELAFRWDKTPPTNDERKIIFFDQFEEVFIWVQEQERLSNLFRHIAYLLESRRNCDLVFVVRDEFFSQLQDLEEFAPHILEEQMRVRHVDHAAASEIIAKTAKEADMLIEDVEVIEKIIRNVSEEDGRVNLTYLQLYLDRLREAVGVGGGSGQ